MFTFKINQSASIPITCPKCSHKQNELISKLRTNPKVRCGGCGISIEIRGDDLDRLMKTLERFKR